MSALRFLRSERIATQSLRWFRQPSSTFALTSSHAAMVNTPTSFSSVTDATSLLPENGMALRRTAAEVVIAPIPTTKPQCVGIRCQDDFVDFPETSAHNLRAKLGQCITATSLHSYEELLMCTTALYRKSPSRHWWIHSCTLINYAAQCLVDQKPAQATQLLRQGIGIISFFEGDTTVLHLRMILANALTLDGQCFAALCEYESTLALLQDYPVDLPSQVIPGVESRIALSRSYITEEFDRFIANKEATLRAVDQGNQHTKVCSDNTDKVRATLSLARLLRRVHEKEKSLPLYTSCLRLLLDTPDLDLEIRVVHDIGLLLCFEMFDMEQGLSYLRAAAEMSFDRVKTELEVVRRHNAAFVSSSLSSSTQKRSQSRSQSSSLSSPSAQEGPLLEAILSIRRAAFTLLDTAVCLAENEEVGDALVLFEESISLMKESGLKQHSAWAHMKYADALATASFTDKSIREYLAIMDILRQSSQDELQVACMGLVLHLPSAEVEGKLAHCFQSHVKEYRRACVHYFHAIRRCGVDIRCPFPLKHKNKDVTKPNVEEIDPETLCWMLENYASCCERVGHVTLAEEVLEQRVSVEKALGGSCAAAMLRLAQLHTTNDTPAKALKVYLELLALPDDAVEPDVLFQVACDFAGICYSSKDEDMETHLCSAIAMSKSDANISEEQTNAIVVAAFKRTANVIMAINAVDESRGKACREEELKALMTLSRGGFFCQRRGDEAGSAELYHLAVEYTKNPKNGVSEEYPRELAIMLANYATVLVHKDIKMAEELYDRAISVCPTEESVSAAAASFFVLTANYSKGRACVERMIDASTNGATLSRLYGKLAWLAVVCWDELSAGLRQECLQHLLLALGMKSETDSISASKSDTEGVEKVVDESYKKQLLRGIALSQDEDTVSLVGYVAQTKMNDSGKFVNACYKVALTRFPNNTTLLVNYARFCADHHAVALSRKYYAAAFALSHKDPRGSECYADFLSTLKGGEQAVVGESLVRFQVEQCAHNPSSSVKAQTQTLYAKYVAACLPSPTVPAIAFEESIKENPFDPRAAALYSSFLWNLCGRALDARKETKLKQQLALKVESLYLNCLERQSNCVPLLTALGAFYVEAGDRFEDAVRILEEARALSPSNVAVIRLLCAAFHEECMKEQKKNNNMTSNTRLNSMLENTRQLYETAMKMDSSDKWTLSRYCQFAFQGLHDMDLAKRLLHHLRKLS